ncbi:MAG: hypothetical protein M1825_002916 [Sarcosagium campestre]|nr:MAG: hypothetical protein M1825_002916 [Sarcosagium campestre]
MPRQRQDAAAPRRLGMTRSHGPPSSLLSIVNGKPTSSYAKLTRRRSPEIHDDPISTTDDDDDNIEDRQPYLQDHVSNAEESAPAGEAQGRGKASSKSKAKSTNHRSSRAAVPQSNSPKRRRDDIEDEDQEDDFAGFSEMFSSSQKRMKASKGYGSAIANIHGRKKARKPVVSKPSKTLSGGTKKAKASSGFRVPKLDFDSGETSPTSSPLESTFKVPRMDVDSPASSQEQAQTTFKVPKGISQRSSSTSPKRRRTDAVFKQPAISSSQPSGMPQSSSTHTSASSKAFAALDMSGPSDTSSLSTPPDSPTTTSGDSSAAAADEESSSCLKLPHTAARAAEGAPRCPLCDAVVDQELLETFNGGRRMNVRAQQDFCRTHRRKMAEEQWSRKSYPAIDWARLPRRIETHFALLDDVLHERRPSVFRDELQRLVGTGSKRALRHKLLSAGSTASKSGYYGSRGEKVMMDVLARRFSADMRQLAATNSLVMSGGWSAYVQEVLVPELATLLVQEDMQLPSAHEARLMLGESGDIGELLNEEEDDDLRHVAELERQQEEEGGHGAWEA